MQWRRRKQVSASSSQGEAFGSFAAKRKLDFPVSNRRRLETSFAIVGDEEGAQEQERLDQRGKKTGAFLLHMA